MISRRKRSMKKPILAITMGDPAGIGSEITVKALSRFETYEHCRPLVIGDKNVMRESAKISGCDNIQINSVSSVKDAKFTHGIIDVLHIKAIDTNVLQRGKVSAEAGDAAYKYVEKAISLAMAGEVDATVTNPLNKEALHLGGHNFAGHTEIYAALTGTKNYTMMLAHGNLRIVHVSTHVSLRQACERVKKDRILEVIKIADSACKSLGIQKPRIAVAGLNPHCGEGGLFGTEEIYEINPAIAEAKTMGLDVEGAIPPDTVFSKACGGMYDIVVAMYHDQGHIPLKMVGFNYNSETGKWDNVSGVNITLGLPIIRTSVDHGTAFDQAGKGTATDESLINAIEYAIQIAKNR